MVKMALQGLQAQVLLLLTEHPEVVAPPELLVLEKMVLPALLEHQVLLEHPNPPPGRFATSAASV